MSYIICTNKRNMLQQDADKDKSDFVCQVVRNLAKRHMLSNLVSIQVVDDQPFRLTLVSKNKETSTANNVYLSKSGAHFPY